MPLISGLVVESGGTLIKQQVVGRASMELGPGYKLDYQDSKHCLRDTTSSPYLITHAYHSAGHAYRQPTIMMIQEIEIE